MRRGGPHPCLPGVPFVILTLHSGMEGETERQRGRSAEKVGRDRNGRGTVRECVWRLHGYTTHIQREAGRGKKPLDPAILSLR